MRAAPLLLLLAACSGSGSDIGPKLPSMSSDSFKVQVLDDQGRGVCGARVLVTGVATVVSGSSGRADLLAGPSGFRLVTIDGRAASAVAGDMLPVLTFGAVFGGGELPAPVHLPDLSASAGLVLGSGVLGAQVVLDDSASSGAILTLPAGTAVGIGGPISVTLRTGSLQSGHLPVALPPVAGAWLNGRAILVDPPQASFVPGINLSVPDDLQLGGGTAVLWFLDPDSGSWTQTGTGSLQGGRIVSTGAVARGGLYVFAFAVTGTASVTGRVLNAANEVLATVQARSGGVTGLTEGGGHFTLTGLPATFADGSARSALVELRGGRLQLPFGTSVMAALQAGATTNLGDIPLHTTAGGNVRVQQIVRSRAAVLKRCSIGSLDYRVAIASLSNEAGAFVFEEVPAGYYGFTLGFPFSDEKLFECGVTGFLDSGRTWTDVYQFYGTVYWYTGNRNVRLLAIDSTGGGPVLASVLRGSTDNAGLQGITDEAGAFITERGCDGRATACVSTSSDGRTTTAAFSLERPDAEHLNLPLLRADRTPVGAFDRHGLVAGMLTGASPAALHRLRSTRLMEVSEWFDDVFLGLPVRSRMPLKTDPATGGLAFRAGVAVPRGNLAAVEGTSALGRFTMARAGVVAGLAVTEGTEQPLDIALDLLADTPFAFGAVLADLALPANLLTADLGMQRPDGTAVDVVRGINGNVSVSGTDATVMLPAIAGPVAGQEWLVALSATGPGASGTVSQRALQRVSAAGTVPVPLLPLPQVTAPADAGQVSVSGFTVQFTLPTGSSYAVLELRSSAGNDTRYWQAVVPPDQTSFRFPQLQQDVPNPLVAGRSYTLTLTAFRITTGVILQSDSQYRDLTSYMFSVDTCERGVTAMSSHAITITVN